MVERHGKRNFKGRVSHKYKIRDNNISVVRIFKLQCILCSWEQFSGCTKTVPLGLKINRKIGVTAS